MPAEIIGAGRIFAGYSRPWRNLQIAKKYGVKNWHCNLILRDSRRAGISTRI
jgi:hypothetical protein